MRVEIDHAGGLVERRTWSGELLEMLRCILGLGQQRQGDECIGGEKIECGRTVGRMAERLRQRRLSGGCQTSLQRRALAGHGVVSDAVLECGRSLAGVKVQPVSQHRQAPPASTV